MRLTFLVAMTAVFLSVDLCRNFSPTAQGSPRKNKVRRMLPPIEWTLENAKSCPQRLTSLLPLVLARLVSATLLGIPRHPHQETRPACCWRTINNKPPLITQPPHYGTFSSQTRVWFHSFWTSAYTPCGVFSGRISRGGHTYDAFLFRCLHQCNKVTQHFITSRAG